MNKANLALVMILTSVLVLNFLSGAGTVDEMEEPVNCECSRAANFKDTFDSGLDNETVGFASGGGSNTDVSITLPKGCRINSASFDMEPVHGLGQSLDDLKQYLFTSEDITNISAVDSLDVADIALTEEAFHLFEFNLSGVDVVDIDVYHVGSGISTWLGTGNYNLSVYNFTKEGFDQLGSYNQVDQVKLENNITENLGKESDYINETTDLLYVLLSDSVSIFSAAITNYVALNITTSGAPVIKNFLVTSDKQAWNGTSPDADFVGKVYPQNVELDIDNDGSEEYSMTGVFTNPVTIDDNEGFKQALQDAVNDPAASSNVHITLLINSTEQGQIRLTNLSIDYSTNTAPDYHTLIGPTIFMDEDDPLSGIGLINITDHFSDETAIIDVVLEKKDAGQSNVDGVVNGWDVDFTAASGFWGTEQFKITVWDAGYDDDEMTTADNWKAETLWFNVTVRPSDDAPVILKVDADNVVDHMYSFTGGKAVEEDSVLEFNVYAEDIDGDDIEYLFNTTDQKMSIDAETGNVTYAPTQEDIGLHYIQVTAREENTSASPKLEDYVNITIEVVNVNDVPSIISFTDQDDFKVVYEPGATVLECEEDSTFYWSIEHFDEDGDDVTYSMNVTNPRLSFFESNLTFFPIQEDVGVHHINITIDDGTETNYSLVVIEVFNVNDAPEIGTIEFAGGVKNLTVQFSTQEAFDEDGDELSYKWSFGDGATKIGFQENHTYKEPGNYTVTLLISDLKAQNTTSIIVEVTAPDPVIVPGDDDDDDNTTDDDVVDDDINTTDDDVTPDDDVVDDDTNTTDDDVEPDDDVADDDDDSDDKGGLLLFGIIGGVLLLLLIVVVIVVLLIVMKKKKQEELPDPGQPQAQQQAGPAPVVEAQYQDPNAQYQDPQAQQMGAAPQQQQLEQPQGQMALPPAQGVEGQYQDPAVQADPQAQYADPNAQYQDPAMQADPQAQYADPNAQYQDPAVQADPAMGQAEQQAQYTDSFMQYRGPGALSQNQQQDPQQ